MGVLCEALRQTGVGPADRGQRLTPNSRTARAPAAGTVTNKERKQVETFKLWPQRTSEAKSAKEKLKRRKRSPYRGLVHVQAIVQKQIVTFTDPIGQRAGRSSSGVLGCRGIWRKELPLRRSRRP